VETGKSPASRAALIFEGREWGKPQARFSGEQSDEDPVKTSRGNDGGCRLIADNPTHTLPS